MTSLSMNERARELADVMTEDATGLRVAVQTLPGGARVIDAGVAVDGGYNAGLLLSEICMGGLGDVDYATLTLGGTSWPGVQVRTDHPAEACMASQYAGWAINVGKYFAMGSGAGRTITSTAAGPRPGGEGAVREAALRRGGQLRGAGAGGEAAADG